jgi:hypothetical protein
MDLLSVHLVVQQLLDQGGHLVRGLEAWEAVGRRSQILQWQPSRQPQMGSPSVRQEPRTVDYSTARSGKIDIPASALVLLCGEGSKL